MKHPLIELCLRNVLANCVEEIIQALTILYLYHVSSAVMSDQPEETITSYILQSNSLRYNYMAILHIIITSEILNSSLS